jgi:hypothetical protein
MTINKIEMIKALKEIGKFSFFFPIGKKLLIKARAKDPLTPLVYLPDGDKIYVEVNDQKKGLGLVEKELLRELGIL